MIDRVELSPEELPGGQGSPTCASGGDQLRLAARTIAFGRVGGHGDGVGGFSLQICDDHFL